MEVVACLDQKPGSSRLCPARARLFPRARATHVQGETTAAETGILDLQKWASSKSVASMLTVSRQPVAPGVRAPGPATDPKFEKTTFQKDDGVFELN